MNEFDDEILSTAQATPSAVKPQNVNPYGTSTPSLFFPTVDGNKGSAPAETQNAFGEVEGDRPFAVGGEAGEDPNNPHQEVGTSGAESGEEFAEATPEQLAGAESGEESAVGDLRSIEGFEFAPASEAAGIESDDGLSEAGSEAQGEGEEFFPILASLAPMLVSSIGPSIAKGVLKRLSPRARRRIKSHARPVAGAAIKVAAGLARKGVAGKGLSLIAKLLEAAEQQPGGESGMESGPALEVVEQAAAAIEVIIGSDDRIRISATTQLPWRRICALRITFPSGSSFRGTGFLIGPRAVATAGHCVYMHNQGGWARRVEVIPGCNGAQRPFGQVNSSSLRSVSGWVNGRKPESDYGCIILPAGAFGGANLGSFGCANFPTTSLLAQAAVVAGYPGDKPFAEMWGMARRIKTVTAKTLVYDIDTMGGQSGAPVYIKRNGQRYVVGIHNYGASSGNSATRVTQPVYERLVAWSKL